MAINTLGRNELIPAGGVADQVLSIGGGGHIDLMKITEPETNICCRIFTQVSYLIFVYIFVRNLYKWRLVAIL